MRVLFLLLPFSVVAHGSKSRVIDLDTNYYYNERYGYEVTFPKDWDIELDTGIYGLIAYAPGEGFRPALPNITIVTERYEFATFDSCKYDCFYRSSFNSFNALCKNEVQVSDVKVDGKKAKLLKVECIGEVSTILFKQYLIYYNDMGYAFHIKGLKHLVEAEEKKIKRIIKSFHFIDPNGRKD